jgi:hypothetical protein
MQRSTIQTFKAHFISGLCSTDPKFPAIEWDRLLLPQATMTLNLLRTSRINPHLSAYATLFGIHNFNTSPLAPPGTRVVIHEKVDNRLSWATHSTDGWYIGPSMHHYRCVQCLVPNTSRVWDVDTLTFFPHSIPFPKTTTEEYLRQSVGDILELISHPPTNYLFSDLVTVQKMPPRTLLLSSNGPRLHHRLFLSRLLPNLKTYSFLQLRGCRQKSPEHFHPRIPRSQSIYLQRITHHLRGWSSQHRHQ